MNMNYSIPQQTSYWARSLGITAKDLDRHPRISDLVVLINIRQEFDCEFNQTQQEYLTNLWHYVYNNKYKLKKYHYSKLEKIVKALQSQRQALKAKKHKQAIIIGKIQRLKMKGSENPATTL